MSLLAEPNFDDPANMEAAVLLKDSPSTFISEVQKCVKRSVDEVPVGWISPETLGLQYEKRMMDKRRALGLSNSSNQGETKETLRSCSTASEAEEYVYSEESEEDDEDGDHVGMSSQGNDSD